LTLEQLLTSSQSLFPHLGQFSRFLRENKSLGSEIRYLQRFKRNLVEKKQDMTFSNFLTTFEMINIFWAAGAVLKICLLMLRSNIFKTSLICLKSS